VADAHFEAPRLAEIYDPLDPDRSDLDAYVARAAGFGARAVLISAVAPEPWLARWLGTAYR
jgi:hypothetical protein